MVYSLFAAFICIVIGAIISCALPFFTHSITLNLFSMPLVLCMYNAPLSIFLWIAFGCGLLQDCLVLSPRIGFLAFSFVIAARALYPVRLYFFKDAGSTLPIMTVLFSTISALIATLTSLFFDCGLHARGLQAYIVQPLYDAFFGMIIFVLFPFFFSRYRMVFKRRKT